MPQQSGHGPVTVPAVSSVAPRAGLVPAVLQDASCHSYQVLNSNWDFLPQFAHTQIYHGTVLTLHLRDGEAEKRELRSLMEASTGSTGCAGWVPPVYLLHPALVLMRKHSSRHSPQGWS